MAREHFWIAIVGIAIVNGLFSPMLGLAFAAWPIWYPFFLPAHISLVLFLSSLMVSTITLMIAGVPAAIYERASGAKETDRVSLWIWLAGALVLSLPAIQTVIGLLRG